MRNFAERLQWCCTRGKMTTADLSRWFGRPYHTVRSWIEWGVEPRGPRATKVFNELTVLEDIIKAAKVLPVPDTLSHFERPKFIAKIRHDNDARISKLHPTGHRVARRVRPAAQA